MFVACHDCKHFRPRSDQVCGHPEGLKGRPPWRYCPLTEPPVLVVERPNPQQQPESSSMAMSSICTNCKHHRPLAASVCSHPEGPTGREPWTDCPLAAPLASRGEWMASRKEGVPVPVDDLTEHPIARDPGTPKRHPHYFKDVSKLDTVDVYAVCQLFGVDDPSGALHHAIKKLLCAGIRGAGKNKAKDIQEAVDSLQRYLELTK